MDNFDRDWLTVAVLIGYGDVMAKISSTVTNVDDQPLKTLIDTEIRK